MKTPPYLTKLYLSYLSLMNELLKLFNSLNEFHDTPVNCKNKPKENKET